MYAPRVIDRAGWQPGPWDDEGDREEWLTQPGYPGLLQRNHIGTWCGYVAVPPGHPCHGVDYENLADLEVHGGLTYANASEGAICWANENVDWWWIGFDCGHYPDMVPGLFTYARIRLYEGNSNYRNADYARGNVEILAYQLAKLGTPHA